MTSYQLIECLDENKEHIPDGVYLNILNLLKDTQKSFPDYKLLEITYIVNKIITTNHDECECEPSITFNTNIISKKVYYNKSHKQLDIGEKIDFKNIDGIHTVIPVNENSDTKIVRYNDNDVIIEYSKYVLINFKDIL